MVESRAMLLLSPAAAIARRTSCLSRSPLLSASNLVNVPCTKFCKPAFSWVLLPGEVHQMSMYERVDDNGSLHATHADCYDTGI